MLIMKSIAMMQYVLSDVAMPPKTIDRKTTYLVSKLCDTVTLWDNASPTAFEQAFSIIQTVISLIKGIASACKNPLIVLSNSCHDRC